MYDNDWAAEWNSLVETLGAEFMEALEDDINTARAICDHRRTFRADDSLSRAVTTVSRANASLAASEDDIRVMGAPQECYAQVGKGHARRVRNGIHENGYSMVDYILAMEDRVDGKQAFQRQWIPDTMDDVDWLDYRRKREIIETRRVVFDLDVTDHYDGSAVVRKGQAILLKEARAALRGRLEWLVALQVNDDPESVRTAARARYALRQINRVENNDVVLWG